MGSSPFKVTMPCHVAYMGSNSIGVSSEVRHTGSSPVMGMYFDIPMGSSPIQGSYHGANMGSSPIGDDSEIRYAGSSSVTGMYFDLPMSSSPFQGSVEPPTREASRSSQRQNFGSQGRVPNLRARYDGKKEVERLMAQHRVKRHAMPPVPKCDIDDDDVTVNASNQSSKAQGWGDLGWDTTTQTMCLSTDDELPSDKEPQTQEEFAAEELQAGAYVTCMMQQRMRLPFGGQTVNKLADKWKRKIRNRNQRKYGQDEKPRRFVETYSPIPSPATTTKFGAWLNMVQDGGYKDLPNSSLIFDTKKLVNMVEFAISDSGATAHFILEGAPVVNMKVAEFPLAIKLPDGAIIYSTHTCNLDIPWLPQEITEAHIVPGLAHSSLISTRKFTEAGCKVVFDKYECRVYYQGEMVLSGGKDKVSGMWKLPINPINKNNSCDYLDLAPPSEMASHAANTLYTLPHKQQQLRYMHQMFFSPPNSTIIKAANNDQLKGILFLNKPELVRKYLAPSPATSKGRMKRVQSNLRSTRTKVRPKPDDAVILGDQFAGAGYKAKAHKQAHVIQPGSQGTSNVFCCAALGDATTGTSYTDMTGSFPVMSLDGMQYYVVAYDYDTNAIFAVPVPDLTDETIIKAFRQVFEELETKGYTPTFDVTDNQATTPIKEFLKKKHCKWQFVEPANYRVNAAERAIQTFKNHFISGLSSTDSEWPLQLWDQMTEQAVTTLNIMRQSRISPGKSAYEQLNGHKYDWNAFIMAPPGTRSVIYEDAVARTSREVRGIDAWYCGPAMDHYRCCKFYVPVTRSFRISGSFDLFPQHCIMPTLSPEQHAVAFHNELTECVSNLSKTAKRKLLKAMTESLQKLVAPAADPPNVDTSAATKNDRTIQELKVAPPVTTSTNPTEPRVLHAAPRTHLRQTRGNTPMATPQIERPAPTRRRSPRLNTEETAEPTVLTSYGTPNSERIPLTSPRLIAQEALNSLTYQVWDTPDDRWTPRDILDHSPTERQSQENFYDVNIEHFCAAVVHPDAGDTMTKYKNWPMIPTMRN